MQLVLQDADPNGIVTATRDNWTGKAFSLPIADLGLTKELLRGAGVYVLVGVLDDENETPAAYVGAPAVHIRTQRTEESSVPTEELLLKKGEEVVARGRCTATGGVTLLAGSRITMTEAEYAGPAAFRRPGVAGRAQRGVVDAHRGLRLQLTAHGGSGGDGAADAGTSGLA